jgi:hypothetical protein
MIRFLVAVLLLCFVAVPASAARFMPGSNACKLTKNFEHVHLQIMRVGQEAYDIGVRSDRLRHTSRWRPYREVEIEWADFHARVLATLVELSDFPAEIDGSSDTKRKKAALDLIAVYQTALERFADYTSVAVYLERTENEISSYTQPAILSFGVLKTEVASSYNSVAKNHFLAQETAADDAFRSLTIPERHYYSLCSTQIRLQSR